jgi:WD40 repeat protein
MLTGARDGGSATLWKAGSDRARELAGHLYGVFAVSFAPRGPFALTAGTAGTTILWRFDAATGSAEIAEYLPATALPPSGFPKSVAWSEDGSRFCVGGGHRHGTLSCYELASER